jgi:GMP synthase (glutamine-hydrolysing)
MKPLLILKLGSTFPAIAEKYGDFEDWFIAGMKISRDQVRVVPATEEQLPDLKGFCGLLLTGSHSMVTDDEPWSRRLLDWFPAVVGTGVPILAICYGHHLLCQAMGGKVGDNPRGREYGTVKITRSPEAQGDSLFGDLPAEFDAHVAHTQSALRLPPGARVLASSDLDPHQAFALNDRVWGVQFHPEFDEDITRAYITTQRDILKSEGHDVEMLLSSVQPTPESIQLLERFAAIAVGTSTREGRNP